MILPIFLRKHVPFLRFFAGKKCLRTSFFFSFNSLLLLTQRNLEIENSEKRNVDHFETFYFPDLHRKASAFSSEQFPNNFFLFHIEYKRIRERQRLYSVAQTPEGNSPTFSFSAVKDRPCLFLPAF